MEPCSEYRNRNQVEHRRMASPEISTFAISLGSAPRGDRYLAHRLYTRQQGPLTALVRRSSKPERQFAIDLFDEGEFRIELKPGSFTGFLKEAQISRKRGKLALKYEAFEMAARLANVLLSNPVSSESIDDSLELLTRGLDSWAALSTAVGNDFTLCFTVRGDLTLKNTMQNLHFYRLVHSS